MCSLSAATGLKSSNRLLIRFTPEWHSMEGRGGNTGVGWIPCFMNKYTKLESHQMYVLNVPDSLHPISKQWLKIAVLYYSLPGFF